MVFVNGKWNEAEINLAINKEDQELVEAIISYYESKITKMVLGKKHNEIISVVNKYDEFLEAAAEADKEWHEEDGAFVCDQYEEEHPIE